MVRAVALTYPAVGNRVIAMVSTEKETVLLERMRELGIAEADIVEKFVRSSGKGGQNVN